MGRLSGRHAVVGSGKAEDWVLFLVPPRGSEAACLAGKELRAAEPDLIESLSALGGEVAVVKGTDNGLLTPSIAVYTRISTPWVMAVFASLPSLSNSVIWRTSAN